PACAKEDPSKIPGHYHSRVVDIFPKKHIQHGPARRTAGFPVVAVPLYILPLPYDIGIAVVSGIPVFFSDRLDKFHSLLLALYRADCGDKSGFFLRDLPLASAEYHFVIHFTFSPFLRTVTYYYNGFLKFF